MIFLISEIELVESSIKKAKDRKKNNKKYLKKKNLLIGDMSPMKDALSNIDFLLQKSDEAKKKEAKSMKLIHVKKRRFVFII